MDVKLKNKNGDNVLKWSCITRKLAKKQYIRFQMHMLFISTAILFFMLGAMWHSLPKNLNLFLCLAASQYAFIGYLILAFRQKTVYHYSLTARSGKCESYLNFPEWAGDVFKGGVIFGLLVLLGMAVFTGSFAPLLGAGALGLGYAGRVIGWKNEISIELSEPWKEHAFLTLDYKRKIIVTHYSNILYGFELRCPSQELFDECLAFLKTVLSPDIEVLIKDWDAHDARRLHS